MSYEHKTNCIGSDQSRSPCKPDVLVAATTLADTLEDLAHKAARHRLLELEHLIGVAALAAREIP